MKRIAGRFTRRVNRLENRSGTAWNGRYKSSPIDTESYLMACCRYIELNPVRARIVAAPQDYAWSSYRAKVGQSCCEWLDEDPCFVALGKTRGERFERYREFIAAAVPGGEWELLRAAVQRGQLSGASRFQEIVEQHIGRRVEFRGPGRPGPRK
jgi:putative transposase